MEDKEPDSPNSSSNQQGFSLKTLIMIAAMIAAAIAAGLFLN